MVHTLAANILGEEGHIRTAGSFQWDPHHLGLEPPFHVSTSTFCSLDQKIGRPAVVKQNGGKTFFHLEGIPPVGCAEDNCRQTLSTAAFVS